MTGKSRLFIATGILVVSVGFLSPTASAGKPASRACLGESFSALASNQPEPGAFGAGVSAFATAPEGSFGQGIQGVLAGVIPDAVVPNTCND